MRWEDEFTTGDGTSKMGSGRWWDGNANLPHEMGLKAGDGTSKMGSGRSRDGKTHFPQETWLPRWGVEGNEMGRRIYHRRCDVHDGKWQVKRWEYEFATWHGTSKRDGTSKIGSGRNWDGKTNLPQEMGLPSRRWDFQDGKWQVMRWMRWEDEFTKGDGTSKIGRGRSWDRWEDEFTTGDGTSKMGSGR